MKRIVHRTEVVPEYLEPNAVLVVPGIALARFGAEGRVEAILTRYGDDAPNNLLVDVHPNITYYALPSRKQFAGKVRFRHVFTTGIKGETLHAYVEGIKKYSGDLKGKRWDCAPASYPGAPYDRGHIIAAEFGAGMETINLVTMPESTNRGHRAATAEKRGFLNSADLMRRYVDKEHHSGGTLSPSGEFYLPNYRKFENIVTKTIERGDEKTFPVSVCVRPITFGREYAITDIIYATIFAGDKPVYRYIIDNMADGSGASEASN